MNIKIYTIFFAAALLACSALLLPAVPALAAPLTPSGNISLQVTQADNSTTHALPPPPGRPPRTWDNAYPPRPPHPTPTPPTPPQPRVTWPHPNYNTWGNNYAVNPDYYSPPVITYQQPQQIYYAPVISSFTANPNYIEPGQTATLAWTVSNADTVTVSPSVGQVPNSGSFAVMPYYTTTYTIIASNNQGSVSASTTVSIATYVASAYGTGSPGSTPVAQGGDIVYTPPAAKAVSTLVTSGLSAGNTAAANTWLMYMLLLSLLAVAAGVIVYLMVRKPAVAHARSGSGISTAYLATSAAPAATLPATGMKGSTAIGLPARFVSPAGTTMPVIGKLGRRDFEAFVTPEKAGLISRQHLQVTYENSSYQVEDVGSTNGTRLNGSDIRGSGRHTIENGDTVELAGVLKLTFKL
jgi:hypothetical protein